VWSANELKELAGICLENNLIILSDEIHCDLIMPGFTHRPVANISEGIADITVTCIAPSKTFNLAGLSTSSVIIPNSVLRKYFKKKIDDLHIGNGNIFGTEASIAAYSEGHEWVDALMNYIERNARFVTDYCNDFIPEIVPVKPEGTYLIWLDCKKLMTGTKELQDFFVKNAGVGMNEGSQFGPGGKGFMRMNLATSFQKVEEAMIRIGKAVAAIR
jgi:cystathionine beta-lyase